MPNSMFTDKSQCKVPGLPQEPIFRGDYSFNTGKVKMSLATSEYITFSVLLVMSFMIGVVAAWRDKKNLSIDDYLMVGRNVNFFVAGLSMAVTFISSIFVASEPMEVYNYSSVFLWNVLTYVLVNLLMGTCYMPVFRRFNLTTVHEYLEYRFNRRVRSLVAGMFILHTLTYCPGVMYIPSSTLQQVVGLDLTKSLVLVGLIAILYTSVGGTKAVLWADAFQTVLMLVGMIIAGIRMYIVVGSIGDVLDSAKRTGRSEFFEFSLSPFKRYTAWNVVFGNLFTYLGLWASNQTSVHRALVCSSTKNAVRAVWVNFFVLIFLVIFTVYVGLYMGAFYEKCDLYYAGIVKSRGSLTSIFMMDVMKGVSGFFGIYMSYMFSASLSTISSGINSVSTVILEDFVRTYISPRINQDKARIVMRVISVFFGLICLECASLFGNVGGIVLELTLMLSGCFFIPVLGCISLGLFIPHVNSTGAFAGTIASFCSHLFFTIGRLMAESVTHKMPMMCVSNCAAINTTIYKSRYPPDTTPEPEGSFLFRISYVWLPSISLCFGAMVALLTSYLTGFQDTSTLDPRLTVPLADVFFPFYYLPEDFRKKLRFGVNYTNEWKHIKTDKVTSTEGKEESELKNTGTDQEKTEEREETTRETTDASIPRYSTSTL